jgi:hypothetical protein
MNVLREAKRRSLAEAAISSNKRFGLFASSPFQEQKKKEGNSRFANSCGFSTHAS